MRKTVLLPSLANVAAGSTATLSCPVGLTYDVISIEYSGVTLAQMKNIEVRVNGKTIQSFKDGVEVDDLNKYYVRGDASGILNFWFIRPEMHNLADQRLTALGTADVQTLSLHIDIDAGAAAPVLVGHAIQSAPQPMGLVTKIKSFPSTFATSGQQEIDNIPRSGARIGAIHLFKADISDVEVEVNSIKVVDTSKSLAEEYQTRGGRLPITAKATHVDFFIDNDIKHALSTVDVQDFRIRPTLDTSGSVRTIVEYFDGFEGL